MNLALAFAASSATPPVGVDLEDPSRGFMTILSSGLLFKGNIHVWAYLCRSIRPSEPTRKLTGVHVLHENACFYSRIKGLQIENCMWRFGSRSRLIGTLIDVSISSTPLKANISRNTPADDQEYLSDTPFLQPVTTALDSGTRRRADRSPLPAHGTIASATQRGGYRGWASCTPKRWCPC